MLIDRIGSIYHFGLRHFTIFIPSQEFFYLCFLRYSVSNTSQCTCLSPSISLFLSISLLYHQSCVMSVQLIKYSCHSIGISQCSETQLNLLSYLPHLSLSVPLSLSLCLCLSVSLFQDQTRSKQIQCCLELLLFLLGTLFSFFLFLLQICNSTYNNRISIKFLHTVYFIAFSLPLNSSQKLSTTLCSFSVSLFQKKKQKKKKKKESNKKTPQK